MMNSSLSIDQINLMNSILDKELDIYKDDPSPKHQLKYSSTNTRSEKPESCLKQSTSSERLETRPTKTVDFVEPAKKSVKIKEELDDLQSKIASMERMVTNLESPMWGDPELSTHKKHSPKAQSQQRPRERAKHQRDPEESASPSSSPRIQRKTTRTALDLHKNIRKLDMSHQGDDYEAVEVAKNPKKRRSSSYTPSRSSENLKLQQEIKNEMVKLDQEKLLLFKHIPTLKVPSGSTRRKRSTSCSQRNSCKSSSRGDFQSNEIHILNKRLRALNRSFEEEHDQRMKEHIKNQQLIQSNEALLKTIKKLQIDLEKFQKLDSDYQRLLTSFEKSEYIRTQQRMLISNLQAELDQRKNGENKEMNAPTHKGERASSKAKKKSKRSSSRGKNKAF